MAMFDDGDNTEYDDPPRGRRRDRATSKKKPNAADFSGSAIERAVFAQTIQHPATTVPAAIAGVVAFWGAMFGFSEQTLMAVIGGVVVGAGAWVWNYFVRGETLAQRHVAKLREQRDVYELTECRDLQQACKEACFHDGAAEAGDLLDSYTRLRDFLTERIQENGEAGLARYIALAQDSYREGLAALHLALQIHLALEDVDIDKLKRELSAWRGRIDNTSVGDRDILNRQIDAHERRLDTYERSVQAIAELIAQSNEQESALENALLELSGLVGDDIPSRTGDLESANRLEIAIRAARRVEEKMRNIGASKTTPEDEEYLRAGQHQ